MSYVVVVNAELKPETKEKFLSMLKIHVANSLEEPGCIRFSLYQSEENSDLIMYYEEYESKEAFDKHINLKRVVQHMESSEKYLARPVTYNCWVDLGA